ncbi:MULTISPECIES: hypothetical protein [Aerosakkonema]|uniref:hypothetical protein n=1 Tax=Aerosakkonema TaxID=1246629 RepID=UPI0035B6D033
MTYFEQSTYRKHGSIGWVEEDAAPFAIAVAMYLRIKLLSGGLQNASSTKNTSRADCTSLGLRSIGNSSIRIGLALSAKRSD